MFRTYQKNDFAYFVSLIFLVFPIFGVFGGYFPVWTLLLTGLFSIAYLLMVYLKKAYSKWIHFLWFYTLAYIIFMSVTFQGGMMWFIFFNVNLLIWRFEDSISSYRFLSFLATLLIFDVIILPIDRRFEYPPHVYGYSPLFFGNVLFSKPYASGEKDGRSPCGAESYH